MASTTYLVTKPAMPEKRRERIGVLWQHNLGPASAGVGGTLAVANAGSFATGIGGVGAVGGFFNTIVICMLSVPGIYYMFWRHFGHFQNFRTLPNRARHEEGVLEEWNRQVAIICDIQADLREFFENLTPDDYAYSPALRALNTVEEALWEAVEQYKKVLPYLEHERGVTKPLLNEELVKVKRTAEQLQMISDQTLHLSVRSASFMSALPREDLGALAEELEGMCMSLAELEEASQHQLPAASSEGRFEKIYEQERAYEQR